MQFIKQVKKVLVHGVVPTPTRAYFSVSLELAQLEIGFLTPILEASFDDYGFLLMQCWIKVLWNFLWKHAAMLCNPDQFLYPLQREGDVFIMEKLISSRGCWKKT
jgi:hypothetical protein